MIENLLSNLNVNSSKQMHSSSNTWVNSSRCKAPEVSFNRLFSVKGKKVDVSMRSLTLEDSLDLTEDWFDSIEVGRVGDIIDR